MSCWSTPTVRIWYIQDLSLFETRLPTCCIRLARGVIRARFRTCRFVYVKQSNNCCLIFFSCVIYVISINKYCYQQICGLPQVWTHEMLNSTHFGWYVSGFKIQLNDQFYHSLTNVSLLAYTARYFRSQIQCPNHKRGPNSDTYKLIFR